MRLGPRCTSTPGTGVPVRCAGAPDHRPRRTGRGCHCPSPWPGRNVPITPHPRSYRGTPGVSVTEPETDTRSRGTFGAEGPRIWFTSRVTGHRPTGLVDRRSGSAYRSTFIRVMIALRYRGAIARLGQTRSERPRRLGREMAGVFMPGLAWPLDGLSRRPGGSGAGTPSTISARHNANSWQVLPLQSVGVCNADSAATEASGAHQAGGIRTAR